MNIRHMVKNQTPSGSSGVSSVSQKLQAFGVYPKFISFDLPNVSNMDTVYIRKCLLRTSILRRTQEKKLHINLGK